MKPPLICRLADRRNRDRGVTMVLVAFAMVAIIGMATLSIDVVTLYLARQEAQRSADAAALAAARVLSVSGVTGDPGNSGTAWKTTCDLATQVAIATARENSISGAPANATDVTVKFQYNGTASPCSSAGGTGHFVINPQVQVKVVRSGLPTLFSRYWSRAANSVSATALAEAYNPSNSGSVTGGSVVPVSPRCVKPWFVPNSDPGNAGTPFVDPITGSIQNSGISPKGVIGETFTLFADCPAGATCITATPPWLPDNPPISNATGGSYNGLPAPTGFNLEYVPGGVSTASVAVPSCGTDNLYQQAVAGCDQNTTYQCGVSSPTLASDPDANLIDINENPGGSGGDTAIGAACSLTHTRTVPMAGSDTLSTANFPFTITAGSANPQVASGTLISSSKSIMSFPIYDSTTGGNPPLVFNGKGQTQVVIVGFLQVFINGNDANGNLNVTVLNVSGCGNAVPGTSRVLTGSSPVPVRLISQ